MLPAELLRAKYLWRFAVDLHCSPSEFDALSRVDTTIGIAVLADLERRQQNN